MEWRGKFIKFRNGPQDSIPPTIMKKSVLALAILNLRHRHNITKMKPFVDDVLSTGVRPTPYI